MLMLIKGGRVIDPGNIDGIMDILIDNGKIVEIKPQIAAESSSGLQTGASGAERGKVSVDRVIDAGGKIVTPGLIDMHVHLREPGYEYKETIATGCKSAACGGFTAVCCMPNTNPVNDNRQVTEFILKRALEVDTVRVYPVAAISRGLQGKGLCEYGDLKDAGAVALSDDGNPVMDSQLMRRALEYAKGFGLPVISHCEDRALAGGGVMNEGEIATRMGLAGIPNAAESVMVLRDIALCELTQSPLHIAHVSTAESVRAIRDAKKRGVLVTAETAPHYFTLTDEAVGAYNTKAKMNPPLRSRFDREAIRQGLADGTIDVIATDHAPHAPIEKEVEFDLAANGIIGLETSLSLSLKLVDDGVLTLTDLITKMSTNPARILGLASGLQVGYSADITIIDPDRSYRIEADSFQSLGRNTPFDGWDVKGRAVLTMVGGKVVYQGQTF
ncbi:MAG: dihydroorotase [Desulfobacterales bacterium]|uniref:Dihydroorotase n=1 Tax=Candidatus Desulfatibia vada TaxID=2841696 RepID=A0A8J6P2E5_9BACT|nr:dihydroorotase [Candidatus Desulfatibia vada]MBL6971563.1 dihydroorotase [Desulfobacterales bacterium]